MISTNQHNIAVPVCIKRHKYVSETIAVIMTSTLRLVRYVGVKNDIVNVVKKRMMIAHYRNIVIRTASILRCVKRF